MTETPTAAAPNRARKWPLFVGLAWLCVIVGATQVGIALVWRDGLEDAGRVVLAAHCFAFMCQTFAYHAGLAMAPVMLFALVVRRWRLLILALVVFAFGAGPDLKSALPRPVPSNGPESAITILSANLMYGSIDAAALNVIIRRERPDAIVFEEWTQSARALVRESLLAEYPHSVEDARDDAFGQAVFSRKPFVEPPRTYPPTGGFTEPQISFAIDAGGRALRVTGVHILPPVNLEYFAAQRDMARRLGAWLNDSSREDRPDVLIGDFNAVARSSLMATVRGTTGCDLHREAGWWRGSTWPRRGLMAWLPGIRLDHAIGGTRVMCDRSETLEDIGSDHRPIIVRVGWNP